MEASDSGFIDDRTSYDYLFKAACEFANKTKSLQTTQSITTVADQVPYDLASDFIELYLRNQDGNFYIKYDDGTTHYFPIWQDYQDIIYADQGEDSAPIPNTFSIISDSSLNSQVTGAATSVGAATGGQCTLTSTSGNFADVSAGDEVHNTTDGSDGVVLSKTSSTVLVTALFGGTDNDWTSADAYVIQPQGLMKLILDPPPDTSAHTVTVYYLKRPAPVYSDYGIYPFPIQFHPLLVEYAAWLYKYRDREPNFGDKWYLHWDTETRMAANKLNAAYNRKRLTVSWKNRQ